MIRPPRKLGRGDRLTATHYNALLDFVRRIMPLKGSGTSVDYTMGGARINAGGSAVGPVPELYPWKVVGGTDEGNAKLSIYLPQGSLVVADEEIEPDDIDGISSDEESPGYYTVDDVEDLAASEEDAQPLYLVIWRDDTESNPTTNATVTLDPESVDGTVILQATIALVWASTVTTSEGDSKTYGAVATQLIRSSVVLSSSSSPGGDGGTSGETGGHNFLTGFEIVNTGSSASSPAWKLRIKYKTGSFENGLLKPMTNVAEQHIDIPVTLHSDIAGGQGYS